MWPPLQGHSENPVEYFSPRLMKSLLSSWLEIGSPYLLGKASFLCRWGICHRRGGGTFNGTVTHRPIMPGSQQLSRTEEV